MNPKQRSYEKCRRGSDKNDPKHLRVISSPFPAAKTYFTGTSQKCSPPSNLRSFKDFSIATICRVTDAKMLIFEVCDEACFGASPQIVYSRVFFHVASPGKKRERLRTFFLESSNLFLEKKHQSGRQRNFSQEKSVGQAA